MRKRRYLQFLREERDFYRSTLKAIWRRLDQVETDLQRTDSHERIIENVNLSRKLIGGAWWLIGNVRRLDEHVRHVEDTVPDGTTMLQHEQGRLA